MQIDFLYLRYQIVSLLRSYLFLLLLLVVAACVPPRPYPSEWPPVVKTVEGPCLVIAGTYLAASDPQPGSGEICDGSTTPSFIGDNYSCVSLPFILGTSSFPATDWVVTIRQTRDTIAFSVLEGSYFIELKQGTDYRCSGSRIKLTPPKRQESWNIGGGIDAKDWFLYRGKDGSLLGKYSEKAVGFIVCPPMPVAAYAKRWVRWQPVNTQVPPERE